MRVLLAAALLCSTACSTTIVSSWRKPDIGPLRFKKLAVIAVVKDEATRRQIEDALTSAFGMGRAIAAYPLVGDVTDPEAQKATLAAQGCDGAISVRIASVTQDTDYIFAPNDYAFGTWPADERYYEIDTYVRIETHIYALPSGDLLFATTSQTINPRNSRQLIDATEKAVRKELEKEGLLVQPVAAR